MKKYSERIYGSLMQIHSGELTNADLYSKGKINSISRVINKLVKDLYSDLNYPNKLYQASTMLIRDINRTIPEAELSLTKDELQNKINKRNGFDGLTLNQRSRKAQRDIYNRLMNHITVLASQNKDMYTIADEVEQQVRSMNYLNGRLMGTEMNRILNEFLVDIYVKLGYRQVRFSAILDSLTSTTCFHHNNEIYDISALITGLNQPPLHPNCRSILLPYGRRYNSSEG